MKCGNKRGHRGKIFWIFGAVFVVSLAGGAARQAFRPHDNEDITGGVADKAEGQQTEQGVETPQLPEEEQRMEELKANVLVVNKKHPLPKSYAPGENAEAKKQFDALRAFAVGNRIDVGPAYSGYRSYAFQATLFANYSKSSGVAGAEAFSMRPGYSEHQTGLAFDLKHNSGKLYRNNDKAYDYKTDFIYQNAHEFGFVVRYRADWQEVTGIKSEPWHLRYLGVEVATAVFNANVPLETFLGVRGGDYIWNEEQ